MTTPYRPFDSSATWGGAASVAVALFGLLRGSILGSSGKPAIGGSFMSLLPMVS
jgi:hypothetical protein